MTGVSSPAAPLPKRTPAGEDRNRSAAALLNPRRRLKQTCDSTLLNGLKSKCAGKSGAGKPGTEYCLPSENHQRPHTPEQTSPKPHPPPDRHLRSATAHIGTR